MKQRINNAVLNSVLLTQFFAVATAAEIDAALNRMGHAAKDDKNTVEHTRARRIAKRSNVGISAMLQEASPTVHRIRKTRVTTGRKLDGSSTDSKTKSPKSAKSTSETNGSASAADGSSPSTKSTKSTSADAAATTAPTTVQEAFVASIDCTGQPAECGRLRDAIAVNDAFVDFFRLQDAPMDAVEAVFSDPGFVDNLEAAADTAGTFFTGSPTEVATQCRTAGAPCCNSPYREGDAMAGPLACDWQGVGVVASTACVGGQACNTFYPYDDDGNPATPEIETFGSNFLILPGACVGGEACRFVGSDGTGPTFIGENACVGTGACYSLASEVSGPTSVGNGACDGNNACEALGSKLDSTQADVSISVGVGSCVGTTACLRLHAYENASPYKSAGSVIVEDAACVGTSACAGVAFGNTFTSDIRVPASECTDTSGLCLDCAQTFTCPAGQTFVATASTCPSDAANGCQAV